METEYFQDFMPSEACFGCGTKNQNGLHIRSYWEDDIATCVWQPQKHHEGWLGLTCGGIIASIIDCHCIATAMATAVKNEDRSLASEPHYLFVTGSMNIRYLQPSPVDSVIRLEAKVTRIKNAKKYSLECAAYVAGEKTAKAEMMALLVYRSDKPEETPAVFRQASR